MKKSNADFQAKSMKGKKAREIKKASEVFGDDKGVEGSEGDGGDGGAGGDGAES